MNYDYLIWKYFALNPLEWEILEIPNKTISFRIKQIVNNLKENGQVKSNTFANIIFSFGANILW